MRKKFTQDSLLFIGYSLEDINLQIIHNLLTEKRIFGYAVFPPLSFTDLSSNDDLERSKRLEYIEENFKDRFGIHIFWKTAEEFTVELRNRLEKHNTET